MHSNLVQANSAVRAQMHHSKHEKNPPKKNMNPLRTISLQPNIHDQLAKNAREKSTNIKSLITSL
jgi:hypothetical protein